MCYNLQLIHSKLRLCLQWNSIFLKHSLHCVLVPPSLKVLSKTLFLVIRQVPQKKNHIALVKTGTLCQIFKQKCFHRSGCSKDFARFSKNYSCGLHLQKSCRHQTFIRHQIRTAISWTPAATYFRYYVMPRSFLSIRLRGHLMHFSVQALKNKKSPL